MLYADIQTCPLVLNNLNTRMLTVSTHTRETLFSYVQALLRTHAASQSLVRGAHGTHSQHPTATAANGA